jgi:hypothetical protein
MLFLKDVKKTFRQPDGSPLPILNIPEFHVGPGEQMVLVGPSGCGKTALLHVIAGISRPDQGKVRINQMDIGLMSEAECDRFRALHIGYVFQTFNQRVFIRGFIYPGRQTQGIKEFVLVPTLGHCSFCFTQLRPTDFVRVRLVGDLTVDYTSTEIGVGGRLRVDRLSAQAPYALEADHVQ